jgi:hypothetical protein
MLVDERSELGRQRENLIHTPPVRERARIRARRLAARVRLQFPHTRLTTDRTYENAVVFEDIERGVIQIEPSGPRRGAHAGKPGSLGPPGAGGAILHDAAASCKISTPGR